MEDDPTPAELAARITAADRPSMRHERKLRLRWNIPHGEQQHIPLWFAVLVTALLLLIPLFSYLTS